VYNAVTSFAEHVCQTACIFLAFGKVFRAAEIND